MPPAGTAAEIEAKLGNAQIIDVTQMNAGAGWCGATVELLNVETEEELRYQIVGEDEADIKEGRISITSPLARALIGKTVGDVASVQTPSGRREYEIVQVLYV